VACSLISILWRTVGLGGKGKSEWEMMYYFSYDERHDKASISTMHDVVTESQDTTELCDVYLVGSELCGVCCVLWCVGSGFQVQGLGSGNLDPMRATAPVTDAAQGGVRTRS
jgi:hypothetical protein